MNLASERAKAGREVVRRSLAAIVIMSAGCLFGWYIVHVVLSLLQAELFVLRGGLPFYP
ncbi:MAG: hypothetical protein WCK27_00875 [Verrucomicrobiota bacterium]